MPITKSEYEHLESIQKEFSKAVMENFQAEHGISARVEFNRHMRMYEFLALGAAKFRYDIAKRSDYDTKASAMMDLCDLAVPCLIRAFSEAALLKALPERARNRETAQLCSRAGGPMVAALILKVIE